MQLKLRLDLNKLIMNNMEIWKLCQLAHVEMQIIASTFDLMSH